MCVKIFFFRLDGVCGASLCARRGAARLREKVRGASGRAYLQNACHSQCDRWRNPDSCAPGRRHTAAHWKLTLPSTAHCRRQHARCGHKPLCGPLRKQACTCAAASSLQRQPATMLRFSHCYFRARISGWATGPQSVSGAAGRGKRPAITIQEHKMH